LDELHQAERLIVVSTFEPLVSPRDRASVARFQTSDLLLSRDEAEAWWGSTPGRSFDSAWEVCGGWWAALQAAQGQADPLDLLGSGSWRRFLRQRVEPLASSSAGTTPEQSWLASFPEPAPVPALQAALAWLGDRAAGRPSSVISPPATVAGAVELRLLGPPTLRVVRPRAGGQPQGESEEVRVPHRRVMVLLAALATGRDRQRQRDELLEILWPEQDLDRALASLRPTLSVARRLLRGALGWSDGDPLPRRGASYCLADSLDWWIDAEEFQRRVVASRPLAASTARGVPAGAMAPDPAALERTRDLLSEAWQLYRGVFLSGMAVAPWVRDERSRLENLWDEMISRLGDVHARLGELDRSLDAFRSILAYDPTREDAHVAVMRIFSRQGRPDLLRRQYDRLCRVLLEEFDSRPLDATARSYYGLLSTPESIDAPW
jgi:DNA-binding SARP family transcriptional activator